MKVRINKEKFLKCIARVQSIIERKTNMPILSTVLLTAIDDRIRISVTDLEIGLEQVIPAEIQHNGSIAVSGRKIFEILKESKSENFYIKEEENNRVLFSDNIANFKLACYPVDEYPVIVEPDDVNLVEINTEIFTDMINKTIRSVAREDVAPKLSGIFMEKVTVNGVCSLKMVSTDGHRLTVVEKEIDGLENLNLEKGIMIPRKGILELDKMASDGETISIGFNNKFCVARKRNMLLVLRLLESQFPDYARIIPDPEQLDIAVIDRNNFFDAMRRMLILTNDKYNAVKMHLEENSLELVSANPEIGEGNETVTVQYNGDSMDLVFNPRFFVDMLKSMNSDNISLGITNDSTPCVLTGNADEGFLGVIMPMRF